MPATRVLAVGSLDPQTKQTVLGTLQGAFSRIPVQRSKGVMWGCLSLIVFAIALLLTWSNLHGSYPPVPFQNAASYIILSVLLVPCAGLIMHGIVTNGRLKKAPYSGTYLMPAGVAIAGPGAIEFYSFSQLQKVEMRGISTSLFVMIGGKWFMFPFRDLSHARWGEQQVRMNAAAPTDPFVSIVQQPGGASNKPNLGWPIGAVAAIALVVPMRFAMGKSADEDTFNRIDWESEYGSYSIERYLGRGGVHETEVHNKMCDKEIGKAKLPSDLRETRTKCEDHAKDIDAKIDSIYKTARAELDKRVPERSKAIMTALMDAAKKGAIPTKITVHGPDPDELTKLDSVPAKSLNVVPVGKMFDRTALARREGEVRGKFMSALNALVKPSGLLTATEDTKGAKDVLDVTIDYDLTPKRRDGELILYQWEPDYTTGTGLGKQRDEVYLGLTIQFNITMKLSGTTYAVNFDAPAAANFSVDTEYGLASTASVYTKMVDTALDNTATNMEQRVFSKDAEGGDPVEAGGGTKEKVKLPGKTGGTKGKAAPKAPAPATDDPF